MIVFKNTKSKKELAGHDTNNNGKIIFNPGSQTGAQKSDYKFNDISVNVPGTNFQFIVKPEESCELNVNENTIFGHTLASAVGEYGDDIEREYPDIYATFEGGTGVSDLICDMTYREIVSYKGNVIPRVKFAEGYYVGGDFGFYDNVGISWNGGLDVSFASAGNCRYLKSTNDLLVWFHWVDPEWGIDELMYYIVRSDNKIFYVTSAIRKKYNYHLLTYNDGEFNSEMTVDAGAVNDIITVDKTVVDYYVDKISKLYKKHNLDYNLTSYYDIDANVQSMLLGEYCLAGAGYYSVYATYNESDGYYHANLIRDGIIASKRIADSEISFGSGLYAVYKDNDNGLTPVYIDMVFEKDDNNELHFISCSDNIDGITGKPQTYDVEFTVDGYIEYRQGTKPYATNFTVNANKLPVMVENKVARLQIGNIETVGINSVTKFIRIANSTVLAEDTVINGITVKAGSVMYTFNLALICNNSFEFVFDLVVFSYIDVNSGEIQWDATINQRKP